MDRASKVEKEIDDIFYTILKQYKENHLDNEVPTN